MFSCFLFFIWWLTVECYDPLERTIKVNGINASLTKDQHKPSFARLRGKNAWCSSPKDMSLQISLAEAYQIWGIETQGKENPCMWVKLYEIHYTTNVTAGWKVHKVLNIFFFKGKELRYYKQRRSSKHTNTVAKWYTETQPCLEARTHTDGLTDWQTGRQS